MIDQNSKLIRKILINCAITFIVINLADSLTMIADGIIISKGLGAEALAATGLADPSYKIVSLFTGILASGMQFLCAQAMSSGDRKKVNGIFSAGMTVAVSVAVVLTALFFCFTDTMCALFGAKGDTAVYGHLYDYLRGWFTGIPGFILFFVFSPLVTLDGNKKLLTAATIIQGAINIGGDFLSGFVLDAGTYGVGLSTGISFNISAVILLLNFTRKRSVFKPFSEKPDFDMLPKTISHGLPRLTEQFSRILAPIIINRTVIAVGGSLAMSAVSVKSSIMGFCFIIGNGVAESVGLMVQILYSEKDEELIKSTVKAGIRLLIILEIFFSAVMFLLAEPISLLYFSAGTEEWSMAVFVVRCLSASLLLNGCNLIIIQFLQGSGNILSVHIMTSFHRMIALTVFTILFGSLFGTYGLYIAIPVAEAAVLIGYVIVSRLLNRYGKFWNAMLRIPDGFGYNNENSCSFSITTIEEAVEVSEKIESFFEEHGVDKRTSYFSGRCMEELAGNVIEHGFTKDDKKHMCDIRVMIDDDGVVMRIRDDCKYFDIRERYESLSADDVESGIGIRIVYEHAKEVKYVNVFNTNTLIIKM